MKLIKKIWLVLFIFGFYLTAGSAWAANDSTNVTKQRTTGTYLPVLAQQKTEKIIESNQEGEISLDDGGLTVTIPKGTYDKKLRIAIRRVKWDNNSAVPSLKIDQENFVGQDAFEITAIDDTTNQPVLKFNQPITMIFRYLDDEVKNFDESSLKIRFYNRLQSKWEEIPSSLDKQANSITGTTDHLTLFAITGKPPVKTGLINKNINLPINFGNTIKNIFLILVILAVSGIGGWYVYRTYLQAKKEMELENKMTIAGGTNKSAKEPSEEKNSPEVKKEDSSPKTSNKEKDDENQIWIDF